VRWLLRPRRALSEQLREVDLENAELVGPWVAEDPEVVAALLLVVPPCRSEGFEALHLGFDVVGFQVKVHAFLGDLRVISALKQDADVRVGQAQSSVDGPAALGKGFFLCASAADQNVTAWLRSETSMTK
jgi:hypothetical protein